ncbi:DUF1206 domain-containing protein [Martelella mediterranea]|uniref:DUF1206 domain-containing protein n=1 Tax=Martelella mediterranea DSM 17316 TaxID=1122214 RepID=A0A1U9Z1T2_9HYPH|nr:DUF1206 domain-containing protein [Martelella mediterranea]AQZ51634.1 hypothetical protein Mame_02300 [Martelella mediterranea DSM 17316]
MVKGARWLKPLARTGYFARGMVYTIIGLFALLAAIGSGENKDTKGALETLLGQPFGTVLIALLIIGLVSYAVWRLFQSVMDPDEHGTKPTGLAVRAGLLASAFTYTLLAFYALSLIAFSGSGGEGGGQSPAQYIAGFIGSRPVSLGLAAIFAGVAIAHWVKAVKRKYADHLRASEEVMAYVHPISIAGLTARGAVFAILSVMLVFRGLTADDASGTPGIKEAMEFIQGLPFGAILLAAMGAGVIMFAAYSFAEAIWREINIEDA